MVDTVAPAVSWTFALRFSWRICPRKALIASATPTRMSATIAVIVTMSRVCRLHGRRPREGADGTGGAPDVPGTGGAGGTGGGATGTAPAPATASSGRGAAVGG